MTSKIDLRATTALVALGLSTLSVPGRAAQADDRRVAAMEGELAAQRERIARLEALVQRQSETIDRMTASAPAPVSAAAVAPAPPASFTQKAAAFSAGTDGFRIPGLDVGGDVRIREEFNFSDADGRDRTRTVLRARLRATYKINDHLAVGGQLTTGDPDDPNSTDVTLGNFADDLDVSLDQAWVRYQAGGLTAWAGKFPLPFVRTDMVWDGDVSPQGAGATYSLGLGGGAKLDARAIYFVIDEASAGRDSDMLGGQAVFAAPLGDALKLTLAGAYYHYRLRSVLGADAGDFRSNLIVGGRYLSDFHLLNAIGSLAWSGLGERWPLTLTGDYVHNRGAAVASDSGYNVELSAGRASARGDWRFFYNYSRVGVDAVFAAFSHDNLNIATNYQLHGLAVEHVPADNVVLNATLYHYRPLNPLYAGANQPHDWLNRVRLNMLVNF